MARKNVVVSDLSGEIITDDKLVAVVRVEFPGDRRRGALRAELTAREATDLLGKFAKPVPVRGRPVTT